MNLQKLMQQAQTMQKKVNEMQEKVGQMEISGTAGGGMVSVTISGKGEAKKVVIDPKIIDPNDKEMLEDLVVAAFNDAKRKADETMQNEMGGITSGMGLPPGFKMPF